MVQINWAAGLFLSCVVGILQAAPEVVIDGYTVDSTLTSPATLPLGRTALLVCRVSGIPHGQQTSYQWTCPNQPCVQTGYAGRKISNNIIAINTTSTSDGGTYTCTVTAGGMNSTKDFRIRVTGGEAVHSFGQLIPNEGVISTASQLQPPNTASGDGRIECTVSSGTADFRYTSNDALNGTTATYNIPAGHFNNFLNKEGLCGSIYHYLFISQNDFLQVSKSTLQSATTHSITANLELDSHNNDGIARVITGYHRLDLGHEMVGQFRNNELSATVTFPELVPGARYRITAWGLSGSGHKERGSAPAVLEVTTQPSVPSHPRALTITRVLEDGIELNWLPPRETNGDIQHYIIRFTLQNGTEQEITTIDNTNYYTLTGLEGGQTYYNFTVKAVNSAHTSAQRHPIGSYTLMHSFPMPTPISTSEPSPASSTQMPDILPVAAGAGVAGGLLLIIIIIVVVVIIIILVVLRTRRRNKSDAHNHAATSLDSNTEPPGGFPVPSYYGVAYGHCIADEPQDVMYEDISKTHVRRTNEAGNSKEQTTVSEREGKCSNNSVRTMDIEATYEMPEILQITPSVTFQPHNQEQPASELYTVPDKANKARNSKSTNTQQGEDKELNNSSLGANVSSESETGKQKHCPGQANGDMYDVPDWTKKASLENGSPTDAVYENTHNNPNQGRTGPELLYTPVDMTRKTRKYK